MLKVGVTGGIGSGKSMVCRVFETLGIPVFYADTAAKQLMETDTALVSSIKELFGDDIYTAGKLNRERVSSLVFKNPELLQQLNKLVHPATIKYGKEWIQQQKAPYTIKEAAIFFETGTHTDMDVIIGVYAPKELRIQRAMQRDSVAEEKILQRMAQQMDEEEKMKRCHYVIINDDATAVIPQVMKLHEELMKKVK